MGGKLGEKLCELVEDYNVDLMLLGFFDCWFFIVKSLLDLD